jgi:phosphosulfolactate phosphohydrolase-like enzyme
MRLACIIAALLLCGCATWDGLNFGLSVANAETEITISQRDGKTVIAAEQDGQRVSGFFRR